MSGEQQMKKVPDFPITIRLQENPLRKRDSRFLCNVRFKNDLPEIPSDPKMLLSQLDLSEIGTFKLFSIEKELRRDVKFPLDMNLPLSSLYIDQYDIYSGDKLSTRDTPLLDETGDTVAAATAATGRKRKSVPNAHWLMRTKYISNESGAVGLKKQNGSNSKDFGGSTLEEQISAVEQSFEAAKANPVHPKNKTLVPIDIKTILPDEQISEWPLVLVNFDSDPAISLRPGDQEMVRERKCAQGMHLKTLIKQDDDGRGEKFTVLLAPRDTVLPESISENDSIPGSVLQGDYDWMRTYASSVRMDDKGQTFLFRLKNNNIEYSDLSTKLFLRKRKKTVASGDSDGIESLKPSKFVLHPVDEEPDFP